MRNGGALLASLLLAACAWLDDPDWMVAEARSPDGTRVARIWCENYCDITGRGTLTISRADRSMMLERRESGFPPQGHLPEEDRVAQAYADEETPVWRLAWRSPSHLLVGAPCLTADSLAGPPPQRSGDVTIEFLRLPCPKAHG